MNANKLKCTQCCNVILSESESAGFVCDIDLEIKRMLNFAQCLNVYTATLKLKTTRLDIRENNVNLHRVYSRSFALICIFFFIFFLPSQSTI